MGRVSAVGAMAMAAGGSNELGAALIDKSSQDDGGDDENPEPVPSLFGQEGAELRHAIFAFMAEETAAGKVFHNIITVLIILNIMSFIASTEPWWDSDSTRLDIASTFEFFSVCLFSVEFLFNFWSCVDRPNLRPVIPSSIASRVGARLWWCCRFYPFIDLCSILPYWIDIATPLKGADTRWVRVARLFRLLPDLAYGKLWSRVGPVLRASGLAGLTVWIICASLYYMFESDNPNMIYCIDYDDRAKGCWNYFNNIPYAMYYALVNFFGEFPLIDNHSIGGRFVAGFIQVAGTAVMAIPAGAFGNALGDIVEEGVNPDGDDDDGGDEDKDKDSDEAEDGEEEDDDDTGDSKDDVFKCKHTWIEYELDMMDKTGSTLNSKELIVCMNGGLLPANRQKLETNELPACVKFLDDRGDAPESKLLLPGLNLELDGYACEWLTRFSSVISVIYFVLSFMPTADIHGNLSELISILYYLDLFATLQFSVEYAYRLWCHRASPILYAFGFWGLFDLMCVLPPILGKFWTAFPRLGPILPAFTVLRILKMERFIGAFSLFGKIMVDNKEVFSVTFGLAMILWISFSTLMYYMERENPDAAMSKYYSSVFTSMWITLLNLSGECPLSDYTDGGKIVTGAIGLVAVGFVSIPMGLLGSAFQDFLEDEVKEDKNVEDVVAPASPIDDAQTDARAAVFKFLEGSAANQLTDQDPWGARSIYFERVIITAIFVTVSMAALETMEDLQPEKLPPVPSFLFNLIESLAVLLFTVEYGLRFYTAPENPQWYKMGYTTDGAKRWAFVTSWTSLIDLMAIVPFYIALAGSDLADQHDGEFRMLRVFRLLTMEKYMPAVSLVGRVFIRNWRLFKLAGFAAFVLWVFFATLLWLTERNDVRNVVDGLSMERRYGTVLRAMPYTLVHLTGDYPLVDYTYVSKLVLFVALFVAVGIVGVPIGLIASGFTKELEAYRDLQKKKEEEFINGKLKKMVHNFVIRWRMKRMIKTVVAASKSRSGLRHERPYLCKVCAILTKRQIHGHDHHGLGDIWHFFLMVLIILNVLCVVLESLDSVRDFLGQSFLDIFETGSVIVFTIEYCLRLWSSIANDDVAFSRLHYATSFWGCVDFLTIGPFWAEQLLAFFGVTFNSFVFRVLRILRILQLEAMKKSFNQLNTAYQKCKDSLMVAGFLALLIWIIGSVLFYEFEKGNPRMDGAFASIPSSMYYVVIFLGGEWGKIDFTPAGQVLCIFYCVVGISICGIPVGAIFEAFSDILEADEEKEENSEKAPEKNEPEQQEELPDEPDEPKEAVPRYLNAPAAQISPAPQQRPRELLAPPTLQQGQQVGQTPGNVYGSRVDPTVQPRPATSSSFQLRLQEEREALNELFQQLNATENRVKALERKRDAGST